MPSYERVKIIESLKMVDHCILFNDTDDHAIEAIRNVKMMYPNSEIIFANGGDRTADNIPEMSEPDDFLKVRETLTRIGVASRKEKKLYQSCHILHKQGRYYIVHFKELFALDGKYAIMLDIVIDSFLS